VRFARLIHAARPRSWRTCGPRRLRRQSQAALAATQGEMQPVGRRTDLRRCTTAPARQTGVVYF
jgi:hypothetical protein